MNLRKRNIMGINSFTLHPLLQFMNRSLLDVLKIPDFDFSFNSLISRCEKKSALGCLKSLSLRRGFHVQGTLENIDVRSRAFLQMRKFYHFELFRLINKNITIISFARTLIKLTFNLIFLQLPFSFLTESCWH